MEVSVLTLISVPEGRFCCALALNAVSPANNVAKSMRFIMVSLPVASHKRDAASEPRVAPLSPQQSWNNRAARQSCGFPALPDTLKFRSYLFWFEYYLTAVEDTLRCPTREQLW